MIQTTVGDLLDGTLNDLNTGDHHLYVVRDGDVIFYVGRSHDVVERLLAHMGKGWWGWQGTSSLGELVGYNQPESLAWQIELLTPGDCGIDPLMGKGVTKDEWDNGPFPEFARLFPWDESMEQGRPWYNDAQIHQAERSLIAHSHPCLNSTYNNAPGELPERYKRAKPDLATTASDFIPW